MTRTKPNKSGLFSGAAIYLVTSLMNAAIPFMLLPILTRYLEPEEYGQIAMFQVLVNALAAVVGLNTVGAANRRFVTSHFFNLVSAVSYTHLTLPTTPYV